MTDIKVTRVTDHPDGTATIEMEMDESTLFFLAKIGMMHLIESAAGEVLDKYDSGDDCKAHLAGNDDGVSCSQSAKNNEHEEGSGG